MHVFCFLLFFSKKCEISADSSNKNIQHSQIFYFSEYKIHNLHQQMLHRFHLLSWRYKKDILPARSTPSCVRSEPYVNPIVENCLSSPAELHTAGKRDKANCTIPSGKPIRNPSFHHEVVDQKFSKTLGTKGSSFA